MSEKLFHENLSLWSQTHPKEAIWLQYVDTKHLTLVKSSSGNWNLKGKRKTGFSYYHAEKNPLQEAKERFKKLSLEGRGLIFQYGVGLGYDFEAALEWLQGDSERRLVFLEDDLAVIARLFEIKKGHALLSHPQVFLYYFKNLEESQSLFNELFWHFYSWQYVATSLSLYEKEKGEQFSALLAKLIDNFETKKELLEEYLHFGATFFRNFYVNLFKLPKSYLGDAFFGKFSQIPAIICGAGPSLQKNNALLKELQDRACIFAGSSSLNALEAAGIVPHFGLGIDPNPKQADRLSELHDTHFPFFYRHRIFPRALNEIKGPKLYVTGSGGYDISRWFEKELAIPQGLPEGEDLEEGHNVVNFALSLACAMGCNPIILVGMDLAYTDMKLYSPGVITPSNLIEKEEVAEEEIRKVALLKKDIFGQPIYTLWKWVIESRWISSFAKNHSDLVLVNATEGGLGFEGIPNQSLKQVAEKWLKKKYRLSSRVKKSLEKAKMPWVTPQAVNDAVKKLEASLKNCIKGLEELNKENLLLKSQVIKREESAKDFLQTPRASLIEAELVEEEAFLAILQIFNEVYSRVLDREIKFLFRSNEKEEERVLKRLDLNEKKYAFLMKAARVNLELMNLSYPE